MSIEDAAEPSEPIGGIHRYLRTLVDVGLGHVRPVNPHPRLGCKFVKLAAEFLDRPAAIPSTFRRAHYRPSFRSIRKSYVINSLVDKGNSVIVIEA